MRTAEAAQVRGLSNGQASTLSALAFRVHGQASRRGAPRLLRLPSGQGALCQLSTRLRGALCRRRGHAKYPEPTMLTRQEAVI